MLRLRQLNPLPLTQIDREGTKGNEKDRPYRFRKGYVPMKEWMVRCAAGAAALVLLVLFFALPTGEETAVYGSVNDGRGKYELKDGETAAWEWTPEEDGITEIALWLRSVKKSQEMTLDIEIESAGEKVLASSAAVSELGEDGRWNLPGAFSAGKTYRMTVTAHGPDSVRFGGAEENGVFSPSVKWKKATLNRYGTMLYLAAAFLLIAILPLPARKGGKRRGPLLLGLGALILLSVLWFVQAMGLPLAWRMDESVVLAWCLHYAAWLYLGVMGWLLFGTELAMEWKAGIGALMLGVLFMVAITPNAGPDESSHYDNAYGVSNYLLLQGNKAEGNAADFDLTGKWAENFNSPQKYAQIVRGLAEGRAPDTEKVGWVPTSFSYPLMFLPQAAGLALGRLLRVNPLWLYYFGRFFNLLFYACCVFLAVRAVPRKKELFFGIALLPMALHQAASYSYDAFTNSLALLWTALAVRAMLRRTPMEKKEFISLIVVGALMAPSKVVYVILTALLFLIPKERFTRPNKKVFIGAVLLTMAAVMAAFWIPSARNGTAVLKGGSDVYTPEAVLRQPLQVLRMLFFSAEENILEWLAEAVGFVFCGYSLWIEVFIPVAYLVLLAVLSQKKAGEPELGSRPVNRAVFLGISLLGVVLLEMVEVLIWTPVGADRVMGIQGRYFIPLIPALFLALETRSVQRRDAADDRKLLWGLALLHAITLDQILIQTFHGI